MKSRGRLPVALIRPTCSRDIASAGAFGRRLRQAHKGSAMKEITITLTRKVTQRMTATVTVDDKEAAFFLALENRRNSVIWAEQQARANGGKWEQVLQVAYATDVDFGAAK